jgi:MFS family permease
MTEESRNRFAHLLAIEALLMLAGSMAGAFSMVFLVQSVNLSITEASLFYLEAFVVTCLICLVMPRKGIGNPKRWLVLAVFSLGMFYLCFLLLDGYWLLFIAPLFFGPYIAGFWVPYNVLMLNLTSKKDRGQVISIFFLVYPVIALVSPIIGGYMITNVGYWLIYATAFTALLFNVALIALSSSTKSETMKVKIDTASFGRGLTLSLFFEGAQEGVFFTASPLLALLFVTDEFQLGILFAVFGLAGGIASVLVGRISDKTGNRAKYIRLGALLSAPLILGISLSNELWPYAVLSCAMNLTLPLIPILLFALATDRCEEDKPASVLTRETLLNTGRVLGCGLCTVVFLLSGDVRLAYAIAALMIAGTALVR